MSAEQELRTLSITLDANEYDDYEEFEDEMAKLYPDKVFDVAKRAAEEGAVTGMHLYGIMLARKAADVENEDEQSAMLDEAREWVTKAARNGCWGAMDDLATEQVDLLSVPLEEQLAFFRLSGSGGNVEKYIDELRKYSGLEITDEQMAKANALYDELVAFASDNGITKKMCDCIFP